MCLQYLGHRCCFLRAPQQCFGQQPLLYLLPVFSLFRVLQNHRFLTDRSNQKHRGCIKTKPCRCKAAQKQTTLVPQFLPPWKTICRSFSDDGLHQEQVLGLESPACKLKKKSCWPGIKSYRHISSRVNRKLLSAERIKCSPSTGKCVCFAARAITCTIYAVKVTLERDRKSVV